MLGQKYPQTFFLPWLSPPQRVSRCADFDHELSPRQTTEPRLRREPSGRRHNKCYSNLGLDSLWAARSQRLLLGANGGEADKREEEGNPCSDGVILRSRQTIFLANTKLKFPEREKTLALIQQMSRGLHIPQEQSRTHVLVSSVSQVAFPGRPASFGNTTLKEKWLLLQVPCPRLAKKNKIKIVFEL